MITIEDFLPVERCKAIIKQAEKIRFDDGAKTALGMARSVKKNLQIDPVASLPFTKELRELLQHDPRVAEAVFPDKIGTVLLNRYDAGMEYGIHTDAPYMNSIRNDISFTLFLSDPENYDGGNLALHYPHQVVNVKLKMGSIVLYPTNVMHQVEPVTRGSRIACVGWIKSQVKDEAKREILRELKFIQRNYLHRAGHDFLAELFLKNIANLHRHWGE
jgi:PKHD-type hydroxylase